MRENERHRERKNINHIALAKILLISCLFTFVHPLYEHYLEIFCFMQSQGQENIESNGAIQKIRMPLLFSFQYEW